MSYNKEELDTLFEELEKPHAPYIPEAPKADTPIYKATPKTAGPKPLTIEEYKRRNNKKNISIEIQPTNEAPKKTRRPRAGKAVKARQMRAELHKIIAITTDRSSKTKLIAELKKWGNHSQKK